MLPLRRIRGVPKVNSRRSPLPCLTTTGNRYAALRSNLDFIARRAYSGETGDRDTGHIDARPNEGVLFFNNIFPLRLQWLLWVPFQNEKYLERIQNPQAGGFDPSEVFRKALPNNSAVKVNGLIPRFKEGGAFVRYEHDESTTNEQVEQSIRAYLEKRKLRPWWYPLTHVQSRLVRGRPFIEDLLRRPPSFRVKAEFVPLTAGENPELSQEQLYSLFRPYGKLQDIESQPFDSKVLPKYAYLDFAQLKQAIMARNCMHGLEVTSETDGALMARLKISYEEKKRMNWFKDWITGHPRIVLPLLFALAAGFSIVVFDPIRTFSIKMHITRTFHLANNKIYNWFVTTANDFIPLRHRKADEAGLSTIWADRQDNIDQLQRWLVETSDTFIVVQGPRGSGKRELVMDLALKDSRNKLVIDCKPIIDARGDSATINAVAEQVGYRPVFSWMNNISGLVDIAAQGATGMKTGFSQTLDAQLAKILANTATALKQIALSNRSKEERQIADDVYLEMHPERLPVVVINNFLHKSQESAMVYEKITEWAARLTTGNIAHVIFLTSDVSFSKALSKALPDRIFRRISLGDCAPDVAKRFVVSHLEADTPVNSSNPDEKPLNASQLATDLTSLDTCLIPLGGRLTDLEFFARRLKAGETPISAVTEIIATSQSEILKMYLFPSNTDNSTKRQWTPQQAWVLIKRLANADSLRYNEILLHDAYKGADADATLQALEQAELITIVTDGANGRPASIRPGKPVFQSAFRQLVEDRVLASRLDLALLQEQIKSENAAVAGAEEELKLLGKLPKQPPELGARVQWLLGKVHGSQGKIERWEKEAAGLKKVLITDF